MGNLLKLFAYLFVILFLAGVAYLAYGSYEHMKNRTALSANEQTSEMEEDADSETADWEEDEAEDEFEEEDLLEDEAVNELLEEDDASVLDEVENSVIASEKGIVENASNAAETFTEKGGAAIDNTEVEINEMARKAEAEIREVADKTKAGIDKAGEKTKVAGSKSRAIAPIVAGKSERKDIPKEYNKIANVKPKDLYMVITGSFTIAENAEKSATELRKKGYPDTETVQFASTKYRSVCIGRFKTKAEAKKMVDKVNNDMKIDAYVHKWKMK